VSHAGSDGKQVWDRIKKYGTWSGISGENLAFGTSRGDEYMLNLYIDDGVADRGHRTSIQNKRFKYVGIAYCPHNSKYKGMVAIAYAQ
jgi:uncharacterized protein YkwD